MRELEEAMARGHVRAPVAGVILVPPVPGTRMLAAVPDRRRALARRRRPGLAPESLIRQQRAVLVANLREAVRSLFRARMCCRASRRLRRRPHRRGSSCMAEGLSAAASHKACRRIVRSWRLLRISARLPGILPGSHRCPAGRIMWLPASNCQGSVTRPCPQAEYLESTKDCPFQSHIP